MSVWVPYINAPPNIARCYLETVRVPTIGDSRIVTGSLEEGVVLFWFDNHEAEPEWFMMLERPNGW